MNSLRDKKKAELASVAILPAVLDVKKEGRLSQERFTEWKGRCNLDGNKQVQDRDFYQTYAPVAAWPLC
jgi:hypothetical protein